MNLKEFQQEFQHKQNPKVKIYCNDYIKNNWSNKYDGIICNPPYFKFQHYDNTNMINEIETMLSYKLNGLTNLYALFLLKSIYQLNQGGRLAYIVPSEFMNSDYGKNIKNYILKSQFLRYIFIFNFDKNVFDQANTTASILFLANDNNKNSVHFANLKSVEELDKAHTIISSYPKIKNGLSNSLLSNKIDPNVKWRTYYQGTNSSKYKNLVPFSTFGKVSRGIATGANDFFIFNKSKSIKYNINMRYLLPCISKSADIKGSIFTDSHFHNLENDDKRVYLLNATQHPDNNVNQYLDYGMSMRIHERHLTKNRNPWYAIEKRHSSPIWVTVFNRNEIKFVRNEANIKNLTTFHCVYLDMYSMPKIDLLFAYLLTDVSNEIFRDNRREYGDGLKKYEPNDINNSLVYDIRLMNNEIEQKIRRLYNHFRQNVIRDENNPRYLEKINIIFKNMITK